MAAADVLFKYTRNKFLNNTSEEKQNGKKDVLGLGKSSVFLMLIRKYLNKHTFGDINLFNFGWVFVFFCFCCFLGWRFGFFF